MQRRQFIQLSTFASLGLSLSGCGFLKSNHEIFYNSHSYEFKKLVFELLKDWCDGMLKAQILNPSNPQLHGLFDCPACDHHHPRGMDAVYPLFFMAKATGEKKYSEAGIAALEWGANVTREDGAWTNELDPKSWDGTTVFGAIALAETLKYHGDLLNDEKRKQWYKRLESAADFVYRRFPVIGNANINYGATTIYALYLIGKLIHKPEYVKRSKELANQIKSFFTTPNAFLFGEKQGPDKTIKSPKGLYAIDLGYNLEESLNSLVLYALEEQDEELLALVKKSLETHLEIIIPDGGLDNSFGNRMYKWSYWGSRTSDGMQPAFGFMAKYNPAFGTAAFKNTELLKQCTHNGLLHGGLHYNSHNVKPCVHHTFEHAKPLAFLLDHWESLPEISNTTPLPRAIADGIKYFEELDVILFARADWRGTISAYDAEYNPQNDCRQATGATLSLLYHQKVGLLCTASMAVYKLQEADNQQPAPEEDIALTPRIETFVNNVWYTNLFDLEAMYSLSDENEQITCDAKVQLKNEARTVVSETASNFNLIYKCSNHFLEIIANTQEEINHITTFVLPIVSPSNESVEQMSTNEIRIIKPNGTIKISSSVPLQIKKTPKGRIFNMVPGVEAIPVLVNFDNINKEVKIKIEIV